MSEANPTTPAADPVRVAVAKYLSDSMIDAYDCTRCWSAWSHGTMSVDDFVPVGDRLEEIIDGVMEALAKERDGYKAQHEADQQRIEDLRRELSDRQARDSGDVWYWVGDGGDHPESLVCPVLMRPEHAAKLDACAKIVAKLPKTADDVPIVPGMKVYEAHSGHEIDAFHVSKSGASESNGIFTNARILYSSPAAATQSPHASTKASSPSRA